VPVRYVIVDNGSTDDTAALLRAAALPGMTLLNEPVPGKNRALNRALDILGEADLVVLTDDDVLPDQDWLMAWRDASADAPDHAMFGGAIAPEWMAPPPDWLLRWDLPLGVLYALTPEHGAGPITPDLVWGPNMAIRGALVREGHRFDAEVGPDGARTSYGMGSETEFTCRLARQGHRAWFAAASRVRHMVRPEQMTEAWMLGRAFRHGLGFPRYNPVRRPRLGRIGSVPAGLALRLAAWRAAAAAARRLPPSRRRFHLLWQAEWLRGFAAGLRQVATA
jgi:hypothetical protein